MAGTTTTTVTESIQSESINGNVIPAPKVPSVWESIAHVVPNATGHIHRWVSMDDGDTAVSKAENADFQNTAYSTGKAEATPATIGDSTDYSDEVAASGSKVSKEMLISSLAQRLRRKINKDVLALAPSCTNHSNYTGTALDTDKYIDMKGLFLAQYPSNSRIVFVGSAGQVTALTKASVNLGGGLPAGAFAESLLQASKTDGFVAPYMGTELYQSEVYIDGADAIGLMVSVPDFGEMTNGEWQAGSGIGAAFWWAPKVEETREGRGAKTVLTVSARYGVAIPAQFNCRKLTALK